jgi:GxxExxY protein
MKTIKEICDIVRTIAYDIHVYLGHGHLEKVYENALANRLRKAGLEVKQQHPLTVYNEDGTILGEYFADLRVDDRLIVELKSSRAVVDEHIAQIIGYLKSAKLADGLLINFGSYKFEIKKYIQSPKSTLTDPEN